MRREVSAIETRQGSDRPVSPVKAIRMSRREPIRRVRKSVRHMEESKCIRLMRKDPGQASADAGGTWTLFVRSACLDQGSTSI